MASKPLFVHLVLNMPGAMLYYMAGARNVLTGPMHCVATGQG
jgi:hypothetical protein